MSNETSDKKRAGQTIRCGHAFPHPHGSNDRQAAEEAYAVLVKRVPIGPRDPTDGSVVWRAEELLGIRRDKRPVYTFVGLLHPELGRVGLIISRDWFKRDAQGVSRCDTGGLAGCKGGFRCLTEDEVRTAMNELSFGGNDGWEDEFEGEVTRVFGTAYPYVRGDVPTPDLLDPFRRRFLEEVRAKGERLDRRLWTWEARGYSEITADDVEAVAMAVEAHKLLLDLCVDRADPPANVHFLVGKPRGSGGIDYFDELGVHAAFLGELL